MKLFVWEDVLYDYTGGIMFAVAETVEDARRKLRETDYYIKEYDLNKEPQEFDLSEAVAFTCWGGG